MTIARAVAISTEVACLNCDVLLQSKAAAYAFMLRQQSLRMQQKAFYI